MGRSEQETLSSQSKLGLVILRFGLPAAAVSLVLGIALLPLASNGSHIAGYCLTCLIPFLLVAAQRREAVHVQAERGTVRPSHERWMTAGLLGVGLIAAAVHAWAFAWAVS